MENTKLSELGRIFNIGLTIRNRNICSYADLNEITTSNVLKDKLDLKDEIVADFIFNELRENKPNIFDSAKFNVYCVNGYAVYTIIWNGSSYALQLEKMGKGNLHAPSEIDRDCLPDRFKNTRFIGICSTSADGVIGRKGDHALMWNCPDDLRQFKETTECSIVLMGGATYRAIGKPLPNRMNIVITKKDAPGAFVYHGLEHFLSHALLNMLEVKRVFIIGGEEIFSMFADLITDYQLTTVPVLSNDEDSLAIMPSIHPVSFVGKPAKRFNVLVNDKLAQISIKNYKRHSLM